MNIKNILAGLVLSAFAGAALAGTPYPVESTFAPATNGGCAISAAQSGHEEGYTQASDEYPVDVVSKSTLTRQQVQAELKLSDEQSLKSVSYAELVFLR